ncbi:unnamed protein product [Caenorhabditis sp. 36 PRJEB53466]|nr:unnamed protein product [Caenorhabditis sp. 36 PRJEB53466]
MNVSTLSSVFHILKTEKKLVDFAIGIGSQTMYIGFGVIGGLLYGSRGTFSGILVGSVLGFYYSSDYVNAYQLMPVTQY